MKWLGREKFVRIATLSNLQFLTNKQMRTPTLYFQEYLGNFNGSEAAVAQTAAWMSYNLAGEQTKAPEGSVDIRMTIEEMKTITECVSISIINACNEHKKREAGITMQESCKETITHMTPPPKNKR